jgi:hypothetical protein
MGQSTTILNSAFASFNIVVLCSIKPHINLLKKIELYIFLFFNFMIFKFFENFQILWNFLTYWLAKSNFCAIKKHIALSCHVISWIPNKHMMTINFDTITNNYEVIYVIKTDEISFKKIDTSFHQPLPNMVQRLLMHSPSLFFHEIKICK